MLNRSVALFVVWLDIRAAKLYVLFDGLIKSDLRKIKKTVTMPLSPKWWNW